MVEKGKRWEKFKRTIRIEMSRLSLEGIIFSRDPKEKGEKIARRRRKK